MDVEYWKVTSCHIRCENLDAEGLHAKAWAPPTKDAEWVNPCNKQILPSMSPVGRLHMYNEEFVRPRRIAPNPCIIPSSVPSYTGYTAVKQDLGMHYWPMVTEYARRQCGGLVNMPKYDIFSGEPPQGKNEVQYDQWIFEVEDSQKMYGEALVREVIICSLKAKDGPHHLLFRA